uniref:Shootin-1 n=1 Tax=Sphenodon punctatus TaxID=8508 RepID=A0A8D0GAN9_SPHPU
ASCWYSARRADRTQNINNKLKQKYLSVHCTIKITKNKSEKCQHSSIEIFTSLFSHMVIEEVGFIQNHLEIEKTCRESAEALATKLNKENKTLKRISMLYMAKLGPDIITEEINIDEVSSLETEGSSGSCDSLHCQQQIKELRDQIVSVQEEKKTLAIELENLRCKLVGVIEEVCIARPLVCMQYFFVSLLSILVLLCVLCCVFSYLVSVLAVEEYEELQLNFELEQNLRKKAESFAQEMFVEQKKLKRQSQLLLQNSAPDQQLLKALDENATLTQILEEERLQHKQKVKELEEQLKSEVLHKEISSLKQQLELLEEDKKELEQKCQNSEETVKDLKHSGEEATDLKRQAVEEMMDRIKKGVHLRPVNQSSRPKTKPETPKPSDGAVKELKGILETLSTSASSRSLKSLETDSGETELERVLRRRKVTTEQDSSSPTGILATSESKSMPVLGSSTLKTAPDKKTLETEFSSKASELDEGRHETEGSISSKAAFHMFVLSSGTERGMSSQLMFSALKRAPAETRKVEQSQSPRIQEAIPTH